MTYVGIVQLANEKVNRILIATDHQSWNVSTSFFSFQSHLFVILSIESENFSPRRGEKEKVVSFQDKVIERVQVNWKEA